MASGFLNVWKPAGMTSHGAVAQVRRIAGMRQVGHAGTLDPDAVGVLPMALGAYTRLLPYADLTPKVYRAEVAVGALTHTGDAAGRIVGRSRSWPMDLKTLERTGHWLTGSIWQVPPQVSALKQGGRRHYEAVRNREVVWPEPRRIVVHALRNICLSDRGWSFEAEVGSGTYVRALVRDWGYLMGVAAHLSALTRIQVGTWTEASAVSLEDLAALGEQWTVRLESWASHLRTDGVVVLSDEEAERVRHGDMRVLGGSGWPSGGVVALTHQGALAAIVEGSPWRYRLVVEEGSHADMERR
ncbi:MAG: tRNA pseudouridine(55) synthase TruB [Firmicutes bacterium]|nr:tRNA pseudouridine(55) synthase TruB [Bacillota bacterium]